MIYTKVKKVMARLLDALAILFAVCLALALIFVVWQGKESILAGIFGKVAITSLISAVLVGYIFGIDFLRSGKSIDEYSTKE